MKVLLTQYSAYHLWANQQIFETIEKLPEALQEQHIVSSFPSLKATLLHMLDAESIWWQRMKLLENINRPSENFTGSVSDVAKSLMQQSQQWHEWISNATEHMFEHEFIYYNTKREKFKQAIYQMLLHIFNHGTYHRGQLVTMLRQLDVNTIPPTDFIVWSRKRSII
ncbi:DinB family protein [Flavisolibacter tropicus]|nr:DinB family protein [Flavisolibacter tropicus]